MNLHDVRTIVRKEWAELYKNTLIVLTVLFLPLIFAALPLIILWSSSGVGGGIDEMGSALPSQMTQFCQGLNAGSCTQVFIASQFMILFMMLPLIIPATLAPYSIVGEKTQRTLEPLLATPVSTGDLLLGKNVAATLPAILSTWLAFGIFALGARLIISDPLAFARLFEARWLVAIFILGPLLAVLSVNLAIMISSRSNDPRVAQQISSLVVFPLLFVFLGQMVGWFYLSQLLVFIFALLTLVLDVIFSFLAIRIFDRESILTRWA